MVVTLSACPDVGDMLEFSLGGGGAATVHVRVLWLVGLVEKRVGDSGWQSVGWLVAGPYCLVALSVIGWEFTAAEYYV